MIKNKNPVAYRCNRLKRPVGDRIFFASLGLFLSGKVIICYINVKNFK